MGVPNIVLVAVLLLVTGMAVLAVYLGRRSSRGTAATIAMVPLDDATALLVQWRPDIPGGQYMTETVSLLLFRAGEVDVRVWSSQVDKPGAGGISSDAGLSPEELIDAAETLRPMD